MQVFDQTDVAWEKADPRHFTGSARLKRSAAGEGIKIFRVEFQPGARTHWHTHSGVQLLLIVEGCCRVQKWGGEMEEVGTGGGVFVRPGEKHWHGAAAAGPMTHLAINVNASTTWLEPVGDGADA